MSVCPCATDASEEEPLWTPTDGPKQQTQREAGRAFPRQELTMELCAHGVCQVLPPGDFIFLVLFFVENWT